MDGAGGRGPADGWRLKRWTGPGRIRGQVTGAGSGGRLAAEEVTGAGADLGPADGWRLKMI